MQKTKKKALKISQYKISQSSISKLRNFLYKYNNTKLTYRHTN